MKTILRTLALILVFALAFDTPLLGWGAIGHMAVAYAAYGQLNPSTKTRVNALIRLNPDYKKWLAQIPKGTPKKLKQQMLFMIAATWPDQIRSEPGYKDDLPSDSTSSQNIGYTDMFHHKYWHFVDTPFTQDGSTLGLIPTPNAETQIAVFRAALSSTKPSKLKSYDLVWLLHLVGDVHQPLHAATRVGKSDPDGDRGGNNVTLCAKPCRDELHSFWDDLPGSGSDPNTAVAEGKKLPKADSTLVADTHAATWIKESFDDAQSDVYVAPIGVGDGPFTLTAAYRANASKLADERVALAGARLANLLNHELK